MFWLKNKRPSYSLLTYLLTYLFREEDNRFSVQKFRAFYGTLRLVTRLPDCPYPEPDQSSPWPPPIPLSEDPP
jgi:hypothetical protein